MRVALIVIAALLALGLSAPGFVATQRAPNASISPTLSKDNSAEAPVRSAPAAPIPGQLPSNQNSRLPSSPVGPPTAGETQILFAHHCHSTYTTPIYLSRIVEIDTTGGPGFVFQHFKQYDFLRDKEIF